MRAASAAITPSATSGAVGSTLTITGTGFAAASSITIKFDTTTLGLGGEESLLSSGTLTTTADGNFEAAGLTVPAAIAGAHTISVSDGTTTLTATYTVTSAFTVIRGGSSTSKLTSGFADEGFLSPKFTATGFAASSVITFTTSPPFTANVATCTTGSTGSCTTTPTSVVVGAYSGGAKTMTATDGTNSATATFTVNPSVAFYSTQGGATVFSMPGTAPSSILIEGYGFPAGTIAANSITIGGVSTSHASITVTNTGLFGLGAQNHIVVAPSGNVPFGLTSVVIGGTTFSFSAGNIINAKCGVGAGTDCGQSVFSFQTFSSSLLATTGNNLIKYGWGSPFISSIAGTSSSTGVSFLDKSSYKPTGATSATTGTPVITVMGYGFLPSTTGAATETASWTSSSGTVPTWGSVTTDATGAFWVRAGIGAAIMTPLTDLAYSSGGYTITVASAGVGAVLSPSFTVTPSLALSFSDSGTAFAVTTNYLATGLTVSAHGFSPGTSITVTSGSTNLLTALQTTSGIGALSAAAATPDLAQGEYTATASDGTVSATDTWSQVPVVNTAGGNTALSVTSGGQGTTVQLRTGVTYGVHGLQASTTYSLVYGIAAGPSVITTFTTSATGSIPAPGVQFTIPAGATGYHIFVLTTAAASALTGTTDALFGANIGNPQPASSQGGVTFTGQYGDLIFKQGAVLSASPTVGTPGAAVGVTGSGLVPSTTYQVSINTVTGFSGTTVITAFTSDASGNVPSGVSFTFPDVPATAGNEMGTVYYIHASTGTQFLTSATSGYARFILQASASLSSSSVTPGTTVTITAKGLNPAAAYSVNFNYVSSTSTGTVLSAIAPNSVGDASGTFTVPSSQAAGAYTIQLMTSTGYTANTAVLAAPPSLTVSAPSTPNLNTGTFVATGSATESVIYGTPTISQSFTNTYTGTLSVIMWVSVLNSAGQTVYISIGGPSTVAAGATVTMQGALNVSPGTYTASLFLTTQSGIVVSTTSTTSSFTL